MKKFLSFMVAVLLVFSLSACGEQTPTTEEPVNTSDITETTENVETKESEQEEKLVIELVAGEQGEYGKMITYNKGTEFEENFYAYYVPVGTYIVTNTGKYMNQINVYSDETKITEEGWEEVAEVGMVKLLDVGKSDTITVEEGQHIDIGAENSYFKLEQQ